MQVAICDDILEHANALKEIINSIDSSIEVDIFTDIDKLFEVTSKEASRYLAIFMDMEWNSNEKSGVEFVAELKEQKCKSEIVCVTAYTLKYIEKLFWQNVKIFGVINKPIDYNSVKMLIDKLKACQLDRQEELVLNYNDSIYKISHDEIVYAKSEGHKVIITTTQGDKSFYISLKKLSDKLTDRFYIINKGILVNMDYVKRIESGNVVMSFEGQGVTLPIGSRKKTSFRDTFFKYISR